MKNLSKLLTVVLTLLIVLCSCSNGNAKPIDDVNSQSDVSETTSEPSTDDDTSENSEEISAEISFVTDGKALFTDRDNNPDYDGATAVKISLNGNGISCNSNAVLIDGTTATIKSDGIYLVEGTLDNGSIIIDAGDDAKPQLVLNNAVIHSATFAPVYVRSANKVFITTADNTQNTLSNEDSYTQIDDNNIDSTVFSKSDLTLNGSGRLSVYSPSGHGIVCKDDLCITDGVYSVESALHGMDANNSIRVKSGEFEINSGKDGFHAEHNEDSTKGFVYVSGGSFDITAEGDGISASCFVQIEQGSFKLLCGNGADNGSTNNQMGGYYGSTQETESKKGIKAVNAMLINGGEFDINSADDGVHSNKSITVNGGSFTVATGDDGFHADETLTVNDGTIDISKCYEGLEALDLIVAGGKISLEASDDGLNAAGGMDSSGMGGDFGGDFGSGRPGGRPGERPMGGAAMPGEMMMAGGMMSAGNGSIVIKGGELYIKASGDGIDANGTLEITGGTVTVCGPTRGDTATLDFDKTGTVSGGTFIGTGASGGMAQTFSTSPQGIISVSVGNQSAGTTIIIKDSDGKELLNYAPVLDFGLIIFSHENLVKGDSYDITVGDYSTTFTAK